MAILAAWFGGLLLLGEAASIRKIEDDTAFLMFVGGCVLSLTLWWRRSHPVPVAVFLAVASVVNDAAGLAALIGLYTAVSLRRGRAVLVVVVANLLGGFAYGALFPDPSIPIVVTHVLSLAILATTTALGASARSRRELIESLRERAARAEEEARLRADSLRVLERERIAREMHDALAHRISMVSLHAGALHIRPDLTPEQVATAATLIRDSAHQALNDLREILGILRAGPADDRRPQPDLSHLPELIAESERAGVSVTLTDDLGGRPVSASLGRTVYRLVQEGLTNAAKHSRDTPVTVRLTADPSADLLHVHVSNPLPTRSRRSPTAPGSGPGTAASGSASGAAGPGSGNGAAGPGSGSSPAVSRSGSGTAGHGSGSGAAVSDSGSGHAGPDSGSRAAASGSGNGAAVSGSGGGATGSGLGSSPAVFRSGSGHAVPGSGSGLIGLAERVDLLDGRLRHGLRGDPRTGLTFDLEAWLPWPAQPAPVPAGNAGES
ncbi:hypothetical protein Aco03nite_004000 [Actinoplanes couchii]|uniref:histidine kinase n=1 Tax=Actinoplanes couchii TaxID=403638 RepID=A0ABQ3X0D2_9ACTN|nr:hypothetical protein Aco03nite_004000 [Actinoplanes couchii]